MVNKNNAKIEFTERLHAACLDAGVGGRGLGKRIADALLSQKIKISTPAVWKWLNAESIPDSGNILALSRWLNVRPEWLEYGRGEMRDDGSFKSSSPESELRESSLRIEEIGDNEAPDPVEFVEIPLLDVTLSAGNGSYEVIEYSDYSLVFRRYYLRKLGVSEKNAKLVRVTGRSMEPTLHDGDIVGVNTQETTIRDGKTYAICQGDLLKVKILIEHSDYVIIRSINREEYDDEKMPRDAFYRDVRIIGQVFWSSHSW